MSTNVFFQSGRGIGSASERELIHSLMRESIQQLGQDVYYIPRTAPNFDELFGEDPSSYFNKFTIIEVYLENWDKFEGRDDYMSKLGLRTEEIASFRVSVRRFEEVIGQVYSRTAPNNNIRPNEGDLIYYPMDNNFFEIKHVSLKDNFYQLDDYYSYVLDCALFQYSSEPIDVDNFQVQDDIPNSLDNLLYPFIGASDNVLIDATPEELATMNIGTEPTNNIDYDTANKLLYNDNATLQDFSEINPFGLTGGSVGINTPVTIINEAVIFELNYNSAPSFNLLQIASSKTIFIIKVIVDTIFNGTSPTLTIGISGNLNKYVTIGDTNLTQSYIYSVNVDQTTSNTENLIATYSSGGSTSGIARIEIITN